MCSLPSANKSLHTLHLFPMLPLFSHSDLLFSVGGFTSKLKGNHFTSGRQFKFYFRIVEENLYKMNAIVAFIT